MTMTTTTTTTTTTAATTPAAAAAAAIVVGLAGADDLAWANARYADIDFLPSKAADLIAIARVDGVAAGLGRVVAVADGEGELGGMYVLDGFKGLGLARRIIAFLRDNSGCHTLYCLPFAELAALYQSMGFAPVANDTAVPAAVAAKHRWCNSHYGKPVLLLRRGKPTHPHHSHHSHPPHLPQPG
ncbi:GNAT family N-acetyltransferase [Rugamonas rubra]|uniref:Acetyltransferase (GNAT) domain-containing protein n=1 Tax=Rugamonas rubra TaxID=758825 RepID=A0A1I4J0L3_9BURK|nr:GNAT family N-acetyltransferase [Rugamonas rubra]SFL59566.1 Acetyltransferase (GNAT) domain-containing protein [Rugamonas rubra]